MDTITLPFRVKEPVLACGGDLKGAFSLAKGSRAVLVGGFGDLSDIDNLARYENAIHKLEKKLKINPKIIVCDKHPGYYSTRFAESHCQKIKGSFLCRAQHHEAHIASAVIDNSIKGEVVGVAFDGTGLGDDGNMWGGEFFIGSGGNFRRAGHLDYLPMPGMDMVVREPWRMAASYLYRAYGADMIKLKIPFIRGMDKKRWAILKRMVDTKLNSPLSSSAGRLFDAVGSMILLKNNAAFEAELPIELERLADRSCEDLYDLDIRREGSMTVVDLSRIIKGIVKDISKGAVKSLVSSKFHNAVAGVISAVSMDLRKRYGIKKVVMSGGVFQNKYLSGKAGLMLKEHGFDVYGHSRIPASDSGLPIGQIAIANR
ncbi:MAG: carbamoyltransferase HypF, partial [Candidatus Omnitrophota bacterium]